MSLSLRLRNFARDSVLGLADAVEFVAGSGVTLAVTRLARDRLRLTISAEGGGGAVSSVFGRTGAVVAVNGDYTPAQVGADPAGQASGVRETLGPTNLSMGAVADGQYLKRSGSSIVGVYVALAITSLGNVQELLGASSPVTAITTTPGTVA